MSRLVAGACPVFPRVSGYFRVVETQKGAPDMRLENTVFIELLNAKPQIIVVITNDMTRDAVEIAAPYKAR